jgi:hypothetical protein
MAFQTSGIFEAVKNATLSLTYSFNTAASKNVDYLSAASLGITFVFHAWGSDAVGRRGEWMAAAIMGSFILIPMIILIIWAARRKF